MKNNTKIFSVIMAVLLFSCSPESNLSEDNPNDSSTAKLSTVTKAWNFDDLNEWTNASTNGTNFYQIESGNLNIFTHPNTWERSKVKTISSFTTGTYSWSVYVPELGVGDMTSIGAFLYYDDSHELDFEIGYGSQAIRQQLAAETDDLILYMSSQANPYLSTRKKIKINQWYNLSLEITLNASNRYNVNWKINGDIMATAQLNYGTKAKFNIFCSVENLQFIGDHIPQAQNYALFNSVNFKGI